MINIDDVIKEVAKRTGLDKELVATVCKVPFTYTVQVMNDDANTKDILFNNLFKFKLKRRFKEDKSKKYSAR